MLNGLKVKVTRNKGRKYLIAYYDDPITGKREQRSTKTTKMRDAERFAAVWEAELRDGRYRRDSRIEWTDFRQRYEDEHAASLARNSQDAITAAFNHLERIINADRLANLTPDVLSRFQATLRREGMRDTTLAVHLRHIRAALGWAVSMKLLPEVPAIRMPKRAKGRSLMRGRPITAEEYERMLACVEGILAEPSRLGTSKSPKKATSKRRRSPEAMARLRSKQRELAAQAAPDWRYYLTGLWLSGLRLEESTVLSWDHDAPISVDLTGKFPRLRIYAEGEKGHQDRLLPMTPDFAEHLLGTPEDQRYGRVFKLLNRKGQPYTTRRVGLLVAEMGRKANAVVDKANNKFATAHDLRRAFGTRWASLVKPATLKLLMRHKSLETSMRYYVDQDADDVATELWSAMKRTVGTSVGSSGSEDKKHISPRNQERTKALVNKGLS